MKHLNFLFIALLILFFSINCFSSDGYTIHHPGLGGGCRKLSQNSVSVGNDKKSILINLENLTLKSKRKLNRLSCGISAPISISEKIEISPQDIEWKLNTKLENKAELTFKIEYFFQGSSRPIKLTKKIKGPINREITIKNDLSKKMWSTCGKDSLFRIQMSLLLKDNSSDKKSNIKLTPVSPKITFKKRICK